MKYSEAMKALETLGTAQNRKVYGRHGVADRMFGVSYANLAKLQKQIKVDQALAEQLWASGIHDARVLAMKVADSEAAKSTQLETWVKELNNYVISDAFAGFAAKSPHARKKFESWSKKKGEWVCRTGWALLTHLAMYDPELPDPYFLDQLERIEAGIHSSQNRVRDAMNSAMIAIGMRNKKLEKAAIAAAKRVGKVEVDHGETGCKTPDAVVYIKKANARKAAKAAKKK